MRTQYGLRRLDRPDQIVALDILDYEDGITPRKGWELVKRQVTDWEPVEPKAATR